MHSLGDFTRTMSWYVCGVVCMCLTDGKEAYNARRYPLPLNSTEVGREKSMHPNAQYIQVFLVNVFSNAIYVDFHS